jgi:hypothetical protein
MPLTNAQNQKAWRARQRAVKLARGQPCLHCGRYKDDDAEVEVMIRDRGLSLCAACIDAFHHVLIQHRGAITLK